MIRITITIIIYNNSGCHKSGQEASDSVHNKNGHSDSFVLGCEGVISNARFLYFSLFLLIIFNYIAVMGDIKIHDINERIGFIKQDNLGLEFVMKC